MIDEFSTTVDWQLHPDRIAVWGVGTSRSTPTDKEPPIFPAWRRRT
jgi:hypothetical protein